MSATGQLDFKMAANLSGGLGKGIGAVTNVVGRRRPVRYHWRAEAAALRVKRVKWRHSVYHSRYNVKSTGPARYGWSDWKCRQGRNSGKGQPGECGDQVARRLAGEEETVTQDAHARPFS